MKYTGLIQSFIEAVRLDDGMSKGKFTASEAKTLVKDENGEPVSGMFNYISVSGMLLFLSRNISPNVNLAVNGCAQYMFSPKPSHELTLMMLARYLK